MDKLRELPPRTTNPEPLSRLEQLAILNGLRGGLSTSRIATQWSMSVKTRPTLEGQDIRRTLVYRIEGAVEATSPLPEIRVLETTLGLLEAGPPGRGFCVSL